ncbi:hypothetical protein RHMOL_Rhmol04G0126700 [Rhododendron molle]|uniref:Uncharacterized protein n=1 Tax=Rhododendron molle TaxID=49168 RepID=A0ACC0P1F2_RHOML|nr:hypothetical protein RHMOL_Rhmol04G0126700 [Rhododendron molle]
MADENKKSRRRRSPSSPDWASLPWGILDLILAHLIQLDDYLHFSAVCRTWLSAALDGKYRQLGESIHKQSFPMLLTPPLPPTKAAGDHHLRWRLYSLTCGKLLNWEIKMPSYSQRLCGSSYGWLGAVNEDLTITFFNPFSGKSVQLPPAHPRPCEIIHPDPSWRNYSFDKEVLKFVFSSYPNFASVKCDFVIGAIFGSYHDFAYIKPGSNVGSGWNYIGCCRRGFTDAVYHLGKFYLVDNYCCVISVYVSSGGSSSNKAKPPQVQVVVPPTDSYTRRVYLVVSSAGGDLLLVQALPHPTRWQTAGFKIFKLLGLDSIDHQKFAELVEINNLGNDALFLGDNHSLCVSASNFRGCRPNCIHYVRDCQDTNVYNLEDRGFTPLKGIKTRLRRSGHPPPIWIVPTLL